MVQCQRVASHQQSALGHIDEDDGQIPSFSQAPHSSNTKLVWPVESMSKSKKGKWCEKSKAYEFKNGLLYYHHSVKDQATGVVKSKYEIGLIYDFTINRISFFASSKSVNHCHI